MQFLTSLLPASPIGLECTDTAIRAVHTRGRKESLRVTARIEEELPAGVIVQGEVKDPVKCVAALRRAIASLRPVVQTKHIVLCLPPEKIYTFLAHMPPCGEQQRDALLRADAANVLPENPEQLLFSSTVIHRTKEQLHVAVAAMRKDVLRGYVDVLHEVPLEIVAITTIPAALASASRAVEEKWKSYLLVHALSGRGTKGDHEKEHRQPTITLFEGNAPIDELILPKGENATAIIHAVKALLQEYATHSVIRIERIVVHGDAALLRSLEDGELGTIAVEEALPWLKTTEREWGGLIAAATADHAIFPQDLLHPPHRGRKIIPMTVGAVLIGLVLGTAVLLLRTLF